MSNAPPEIESWCRDHIKGHYELNAYSVENGHYARFEAKADAMKFKLTWLPDWR